MSPGAPACTLLSVNVGMPKDVPWQGRTVFTGVWKEPVDGPRRVRKLNVDGDGQGDLGGHGGEQRAVFVYQIESYRYWERELGRDDFVYGQFGENFTVDGLPDDEVCIGDRYRIGDAVFEVTQPRVTCYRVGMRMDDPRMPALLVSHRRPGFYFRVIDEGEVQAGDEIVKVASGPEQMTVAEIDALLYLPGHPRQQLLRALRIPALSPGWQGSFQRPARRRAGRRERRPGRGAARRPPGPGFRPLPVTAIERGERHRRLDPPRGPRRRAAARGAPRASTSRCASAGRRTDGPWCAATPCPARPAPATTGSASSGSRRRRQRLSAHPAARSATGSRSRRRAARSCSTGDAPVVLVCAGIGATPVLAMLHALAAEHSGREVWWLHGARNGREHAVRRGGADAARPAPAAAPTSATAGPTRRRQAATTTARAG